MTLELPANYTYTSVRSDTGPNLIVILRDEFRPRFIEGDYLYEQDGQRQHIADLPGIGRSKTEAIEIAQERAEEEFVHAVYHKICKNNFVRLTEYFSSASADYLYNCR